MELSVIEVQHYVRNFPRGVLPKKESIFSSNMMCAKCENPTFNFSLCRSSIKTQVTLLNNTLLKLADYKETRNSHKL